MATITVEKLFGDDAEAPSQSQSKRRNWRQVRIEGPASGDAAILFVAGNLTAAKLAQVEALGVVVRVIAAERGVTIPADKILELTVRTSVAITEKPPVKPEGGG